VAAAVLAEQISTSAMRSGHSALAYPERQQPPPRPLGEECRDLRALLALPLCVDGSNIGVMVIGALEIDAFAAVEVQVFSEMAVELGLGIQIQRAHVARRVAEQELRFNLQHFRTVLANQYAGILVMSRNGRVKFANEAFCKLFGLPESPAQRIVETGLRESRSGMAACAGDHGSRRGGSRRSAVVRGQVSTINDGRIFLRDFTPITIDGQPQGWLWHQRDITEQQSTIGRPGHHIVESQALDRADSQCSLLAVGVLDLDRFNGVNDTVGHGGGDLVLAEASARIVGMLRGADVLARFGGDEFALVIPGLDSRESSSTSSAVACSRRCVCRST
jgi:PAS domain S-box-containing protein